MPHFLYVDYNGLRLFYTLNLDGGGMTFGQQYVQFVRDRVGRVPHIFEACAGPGFIGFSLLAHDLCDRLTLADINPAAVDVCRKTVEYNHLEDRVSVFLCDGLSEIPETERWDLVVGNPPHWNGSEDDYAVNRRLFDPNLAIHRDLYRECKRFLTAEGCIILQENGDATQPSDFTEMLAESGLDLIEVYPPQHEQRSRLSGHPAIKGARHVAVREIDRLSDHPLVERLMKDNALFQRLRKLPALTTVSPYYFLWTRPAAQRAEAASG